MPETAVRTPEVTVASLNERLEGYRVLRPIGQGAMGIVFEAEQLGLARRVAIKVLPPALALRERTVKRFLREAEAMGRLAHKCIVDVYEVGSLTDLHFFSMKYAEGPPLDRVLRAGPLPVGEVTAIGIDVAEALAHAHGRGVLHRDVKPSNLLRDGERVVLTDFGLARPIDDEAGRMTESGDLVGTPLYMSPEQISGDAERIDGRADLWGLGVTLYELLAQRTPFAGPNAQAILNAILHREPPRLRRVRDDVPADLEAVVLKCLEKDPTRRYATAAALCEDLRAVREERAVSARKPRFSDPLVRWVRRYPLQAGVAGALTVLAVALAASWQSSKRALSTASQELSRSEGDLSAMIEQQYKASLQRALADARMQWALAADDAERLEAENRLLDLLEAFSIREYPEIAEQALSLHASWTLQMHDEIAADAVLEFLDTRLVGLEKASALTMRAAVLTGLERHAEALFQHRERARLDPRDPRPCLDAARLLLRMAFASRADGDDSASRAQLAQALAMLLTGLDLAVKAQDTAAAVDLLIERARCRIEIGDFLRARQDLELARGKDRSRIEIAWLLRTCERKAAETESAGESGPAPPRPPETTQAAADEEQAIQPLFSLQDLLPKGREVAPEDLQKQSGAAGRQLQSIYSGLRGLLRKAAQSDDAEPDQGETPQPGSKP